MSLKVFNLKVNYSPKTILCPWSVFHLKVLQGHMLFDFEEHFINLFTKDIKINYAINLSHAFLEQRQNGRLQLQSRILSHKLFVGCRQFTERPSVPTATEPSPQY